MAEPLLFCGSSHPLLGQEIANLAKIDLGKVHLGRFPDGEISVEIQSNVRGKSVFVLQSLAMKPNSFLVELLLMIDALKRASVNDVTVILPYFGYSRQDRQKTPGTPIGAKLVADLLIRAGAAKIVTIDLHSDQIEGFFDIPVHHLHCQDLLVQAAKKWCTDKFVVVAPDAGSIKIAEKIARELGLKLIVMQKERLSSKDVITAFMGVIEAEGALIIDDICSTARTLISAAELCQKQGVKKIIGLISHALCSENAIQAIEESPISELVMTNTVQEFNRFQASKKITTLSVASLIANAIKK